MNPYFDQAVALGINPDPNRDWFQEYAWLDKGPKAYIKVFNARHELTKKYAWAIPNAEAIEQLRMYQPLIEIGAGKGYWASLIDGDILCFDHKFNDNPYTDHDELFYPVELGGPEKVAEHPYRTLFLCWPPYSNPMGADCLKLYQGNIFIHVGEGPGGCTGDDEYWQILEEEWVETKTVIIPSWYGIRDYFQVYERR